MKKVIESLFQSEGFFWLTTAVAIGLAAEEMTRFCAEEQDKVDNAETLALFHQCVRNNKVTDAEIQKAQQWSLENLKMIDKWNQQTPEFHEWRSLGLSKGFTAYWLNHKLMELEWQQVLGQDEMDENYQFLDLVLADSAELQDIEQAYMNGSVNEDQKIFLHSHWQRSQLFWENLYTDLQLLALGIIEMRRPVSTQL